MLISEAYQLTLSRLLELGGAEVFLSESSFLRTITAVLFDFCSKTGISKNVVNFQALYGVSRYSINPAPGAAPGTSAEWGTGAWGAAEWGTGTVGSSQQALFKFMKAEHVWWAGRYLEKISIHDLAVLESSWEAKRTSPQYWSDDAAPVEQIDIYPVSDKTGANVSPSYGDFVGSGSNFSVLATELPVVPALSMNDEIPFVPASAVQYIVWGAIRDILGSSSETRDDQRAMYADSRYREGVLIYKTIVEQEMGG